MIRAQPISHTDVHGKTLYYVKCTAGEHTHYINVGEKTYNSIKELEKVTELPLPEPNKKEEVKHEVKPKK